MKILHRDRETRGQGTLSPLSFLLIFLALPGFAQEAPGVRLSTVEEIEADFANVPCKNKERLPAVWSLFKEKEAGPADITFQKGRGAENLIVTKHGQTDETIVIGAHYDLIEQGCGAVDNWSGVVAIAHLYRTIRQLDLEKTVVFVAFGKEEGGLFGSMAMVDTIPNNQKSRYCAMINIDSFGLAAPFALDHTSSPKLVQLATESAERMKLPFYKVSIPGTDADSSSFLRKGIPAVTLSGLSNDWNTILHTRRDQVAKVIPGSVYLGYRLALSMWARIDLAPCAAYR
jgi:hypothetical protein